MSRLSPRSFRVLVLWTAGIVLAMIVATPRTASAQGFPGGMSGGMGGRGGMRGGRGRGNDGGQLGDSARPVRRASTGTLADLALRHRADLQLTDSQATALVSIAERAREDRITATVQLAQLRDTAPASEPTTPPDDSTRKAILQRRRALAAAIAQLHDVDVTARTSTLALLSPTQQTAIEKLESAEDTDSSPRGSDGRGYGGRGGNRGGGRGAPQEP